jgi:hypothetical protein
MNGHPFDAKHTFLVNRFTDIEKFEDLDETYVEPQREEYHAKVRLSIPPRNFGGKTDAPQEHLRAWLADTLGRDQYVTYRGDEVSIRWHGRPSQCEVAFEDHVRTTPFGLISHSTISGRSKTCGQNYTSRGHHSVHTSPPSTDKASAYMAVPPSSSKLASSTPLSVSSTFRLANNTS